MKLQKDFQKQVVKILMKYIKYLRKLRKIINNLQNNFTNIEA